MCLSSFQSLTQVYFAKEEQSGVCSQGTQGNTHARLAQAFSCLSLAGCDTVMSALTLDRVFVSVRSFIAESEQLREQWVDAMRNAIGEALSNSEVADRIWVESSNSVCADCGAPKPEWAAINLCVVICKRCAGLCLLDL